jgi:hypothetical protein
LPLRYTRHDGLALCRTRLCIVLRFAARKPAAQGNGLFFPYPALTRQRGRKHRPHYLDVLGYSLSPPGGGWCFAGLNVTAPILIFFDGL